MRNTGNHFLTIVLLLGFSWTAQSLKADEHLKPGDLVGTWVRAGPADMSGLEFTRQGKVMVYYGRGGDAETDEYSILDDGRLDLSEGGIQNTFFLPTLSGDRLQLKSPDTGKVADYRRLKAGETMAAAIAGQDKADQEAMKTRNALLPNFLNRTDLVMVVVDRTPGAPANCAIQWAPTSNVGYSGRAYFDSKPPHVEVIGAEIQGHDIDSSSSVAIWFGPGTAQQNGGRGVWMFHVTGTGADISLTSKLNFGGAFDTGPNSTVVIKADATMSKQITDGIKAEVTRLDGLKAPVVAMLKDYVVLKGTSQSANPSDHKGFADQFVLARSQGNTWVGQGQSINGTTGATEIFPVMATVGILKEKPVIQILSQKRVFQFADIDIAGGKLSGIWALPQNPNTRPAELTIANAVDGKGRDQLFATRKASMQKLAAGTIFHGVLNDQYANASQPPNPVSVTLAVDEKGAVTGKAEYVLEGCTMNLAGKETDTPLGPQIVLQFHGGQSNPGAWNDAAAFINLVQHETWTLSLNEDQSGALRLSGYAVTNPAPAAPPITLELIPFGDKERAQVVKAFTDGSQFKVSTPQMGNAPDTILAFAADPAGGKINGEITAGGTHINSRLHTKFSGNFKDQTGWSELVMPINNGRPKPDYVYVAVVTPTDAGLYINAYIYSTNVGGPTRPLGRWDAVQVK